MINMGCTKLGITISCLLLTAKVNSQYPNIDQNQIYFTDDLLDGQPATFNQQHVVGLRSTTANIIASQRLTANQLNRQPVNGNPTRSPFSVSEKAKIILDGTPTALTNFAINLMKYVVQQSPGNTVVSPYSIAALLSLLQQGASGDSLEQLSAALQMNQPTSAAAYKAQNDDIQKRNSHNILKSANNIFLANGFTLNPKFREISQRDFSSDVTPTSFINAAQTAQQINSWVASKTDNKIDNLISPAALSIQTQMVLVNAVYFKGLWEVPFRRESTQPGEFFLSNGSKKTAQFMQTRRYFRTGVDDYTGSRVIMLPFEREEYYIMVILPHSLASVTDTLNTLTVSRLQDYLNYKPLEAKLELPKFSIKADTDLTTVLQKLGISKIFEANSGLSSIGNFQGNSPQVSTAVHSAALTIDEEGGSASASTAFAAVALSNDEPSVTFRANRPFLTVLWDVKSKVPLFVAKIEDPIS